VILELSESAGNAMLDVLASMMDGGSIELLTGDGTALAVLNLSNPAAQDASGGQLQFNEIAEEDAARGQGIVEIARIIASDGSKIFSCDVGDESSDAVIKLNTTKIYRGGPVRLKSFRLAMP
jgi:hypothetical protein